MRQVMHKMSKQHRRSVWVVIMAGLLLGTGSTAWAQIRPDIEGAMREFNARFNLMSKTDPYDEDEAGSWVLWPACETSGLQPKMPGSNFYGETLTDTRAAELVGALVSAFYATHSALGGVALYEKFIVESEALQSPPNVVHYGSTDHEVPTVHFPKDWTGGPAVTTSNWAEAFGKIEGYIRQLNAIGTGGGVSATNMGTKGTEHIGYFPPWATYEDFVDGWDDFLELNIDFYADGVFEDMPWHPTSPSSHFPFPFIHLYANSETVLMDGVLEGGGSAYYDTARGKLTANFGSLTEGVAEIYLKVMQYPDGPETTPPVPADGEWHLFDSADVASGTYTSDWINNDPTFRFPTPPAGESYETGWRITHAKYLYRDTPTFDTSEIETTCEPGKVELKISGAGPGLDEVAHSPDQTPDEAQPEWTDGVSFPNDGSNPIRLLLGWEEEVPGALADTDQLTFSGQRKGGKSLNDAIRVYVTHSGQQTQTLQTLPYTFTRGSTGESVVLLIYKIGDFDEVHFYFKGPAGGDMEADQAKLLPGGCLTCGQVCTSSPGGPSGKNGSVNLTVPLGHLDAETDGGRLQLYAAAPSADLASPSGWSVVNPTGDSRIELIDDTGTVGGSDPLRQVMTPLGLVDITVQTAAGVGEGGKHTLSFYHASDVGAKSGGFYPVSGLTAYETLVVDALALDGSDQVTELLATHTSTDGASMRWAWKYTDDATDGPTWEMGENVDAVGTLTTATRREAVSRSAVDGNDQRVDMRKVLTPTGALLSEVKTTYNMFAWGEKMIERVVAPGAPGSEQTVTYTYYDDSDNDGDNYSQLKSMVDDGGYWERYLYDTDEQMIETIAQLDDNAYDDTATDATLRAANISTTYDRFEADLDDADVVSDSVVKIATSVLGTQERVSYSVGWSQSNPSGTADATLEEDWDIAATTSDPEAGYGSTTAFLNALLGSSDHLGHLVTKTQRYSSTGSKPYELSKVVRADGSMSLYGYPAVGQTRVTRGYPNTPGGSAVVYGRRTTVTVDSGGQPISTLTEMIDPDVNSGNWFVVSLSKTLTSDVFDRPTSTGMFYGAEALTENTTPGTGVAAYTTSQTYSCCGVETRTDRYGLVTSYTYDDLGRRSSMTRPDGVTMHYTLDAAGRTVKVEREAPGSLPVTDAESSYDLAGRMTDSKGLAGTFTFYTYRDVKADGTVYDPATDTGPFYQETRVYPHDKASGPVQVTWTDSHGRMVLSLTGTVSTDWAGAAPASGGAELSEVFSRVEMEYDWAGRTVASRNYFDFGSLAVPDLRTLATPGSAVEGTHYYETSGGNEVYDALGRMVKSEDVMGNITVMKYDDDGRVIETWVGTDDGNPTNDEDYLDPATLGGNLVQVSGSVYDAYGELEESLRLKPVTTLTSFAVDSVGVNVEDTYITSGGAVTGRESWSKPDDGLSPWTKQVYDEQGRMIESITYPHGSTSFILAKSSSHYDTSTGRMTASRTHEVDGSGSTTGNYLETTYVYDSEGRQAYSTSPGQGYSLTLYDTLGRVEAQITGSDDGNTPLDPSDDVILTESVYRYNASDLPYLRADCTRRHDALATDVGRLWREDNSSGAAFSNFTVYNFYYDNAQRLTHQVQRKEQNGTGGFGFRDCGDGVDAEHGLPLGVVKTAVSIRNKNRLLGWPVPS